MKAPEIHFFVNSLRSTFSFLEVVSLDFDLPLFYLCLLEDCANPNSCFLFFFLYNFFIQISAAMLLSPTHSHYVLCSFDADWDTSNILLMPLPCP